MEPSNQLLPLDRADAALERLRLVQRWREKRMRIKDLEFELKQLEGRIRDIDIRWRFFEEHI